jgi:hypothetical protein
MLIVVAASFCQAAEPPAMPERKIGMDKGKTQGATVPLREGDMGFTLFLPRDWDANGANQTLTMHFHMAPWFIIQEHVRRGAKNPLVCVHLGEGSTIYRRAFEDPQRLGRVLAVIGDELRKRAGKGVAIRDLELSSFSAGYGAIRELVKSGDILRQMRRVVLADSMYASLEANAPERRPLAEQIEVWVPLARAAMKGEKTFVFTYSEVPTETYASSSECAAALIRAVGVTNQVVAASSCAAARDPQFPLRQRADFGNLHIWGYGGTNAQAHMTHARHLADVWKAIASE